MDRPLPQASLNQRREQTIAVLCDRFAGDRLELEEFERRLDSAHRARTAAELDALVSDLQVALPDPAAQPTTPARLREAARQTRTLIAVMGGVERSGHWLPARRTVVVAMMGGADLDFRDVELPPGETELFLFCMMGGADIIVPPGLAVDSSGVAIMGGFEHSSAPRHVDPATPILRINGVCVMGGVEISVRQPGESAKAARLRERDERRQLRDRNRSPRSSDGE